MSKHQHDDEKRLAELGYKQELNRSWSGFSNFAISFSIISILSGCFTTFGQAWNNGGPIAITLGWPVIAGFILLIGFSLAEIASAFPTSGGIYWWASKLGGVKAGFYAGWLNLIGLVAVTASVGYGVTFYINTLLGPWKWWSSLFASSKANQYIYQQFLIFLVVMLFVTLVNIFSNKLLSLFNNTSVWWHVFGTAILIIILVAVAKHHQTASFFFTHINNSGFSGKHGTFIWYVLPLGFLLTQYTITGYDASAHLAEETHNAHISSAKGIWKSIFYSAIGGYILLLAFLFIASNTGFINSADPKVNPFGQGSALSVIFSAIGDPKSSTGGFWFVIVVLITTIGQIFCVTAGLTSCSRMMFAFSRDGALPGSKNWRKVNKDGTPVRAIIASSIAGVVISLPALYRNPTTNTPVAFYAVVSISVIALYLCFIPPIFYRLKAGNSFSIGAWNLGGRYKWINILAMAEIIVISIYFIMPLVPSGIPFRKGFSWPTVNYAPILVFGSLIILETWWHLSVKKWFKGPINQFKD